MLFKNIWFFHFSFCLLSNYKLLSSCPILHTIPPPPKTYHLTIPNKTQPSHHTTSHHHKHHTTSQRHKHHTTSQHHKHHTTPHHHKHHTTSQHHKYHTTSQHHKHHTTSQHFKHHTTSHHHKHHSLEHWVQEGFDLQIDIPRVWINFSSLLASLLIHCSTNLFPLVLRLALPSTTTNTTAETRVKLVVKAFTETLPEVVRGQWGWRVCGIGDSMGLCCLWLVVDCGGCVVWNEDFEEGIHINIGVL